MGGRLAARRGQVEGRGWGGSSVPKRYRNGKQSTPENENRVEVPPRGSREKKNYKRHLAAGRHGAH